jgi:hypothetical protein
MELITMEKNQIKPGMIKTFLQVTCRLAMGRATKT